MFNGYQASSATFPMTPTSMWPKWAKNAAGGLAWWTPPPGPVAYCGAAVLDRANTDLRYDGRSIEHDALVQTPGAGRYLQTLLHVGDTPVADGVRVRRMRSSTP